MIIQINHGDIEKSDSLEQHVREQINERLGYLSERLTRIEVHLRDDSSPTKHTPGDKRCTMEARPAGMQPLVVEHQGEDFYKVIPETVDKLERVVKKRMDKLAER